MGFSDRLFISKTDLVDEASLFALRERLLRMNPRAPQGVAAFGEVPLEQVFDVGGFNLSAELDFTPEPTVVCNVHGHDHAHEGSCGHPHHHHHDDDVKSFVFRSRRPFHGVRFGQFMNAIVRSHGASLLRYKGVLYMSGLDRKVILQGVHQLMSQDTGTPWGPDEPRESRLVFIGLDLP